MQDFMKNRHNNGIVFLTIPMFDDTQLVKTAFTTRLGGYSSGKYSSLNLGEKTEDLALYVDKNYSKLITTLSLENSSLVSLHQIHSDKIIEVKKDALAGAVGRIKIGEGDALVTNDKNITLLTYHADCISIYFLDTKNKAIGLAHSGWKGTVQNIALGTFEKMKALYNSKPENMLIGIGPGIDLCCFETGADVYDAFKKKYLYIDRYAKLQDNGKYKIDLKGMIKQQLEEVGIKDIIISKECTMCREGLFFSHRRDGGITGRMIAMIKLV